jgi:DNA-binding NarL/FixJ family response regulator
MTVDDHADSLRAAQEVIEATQGFELLGAASSGSEAITLADDVDPELVLVDVRMPGMDGFETTRRLRAAHPTAIIVLVSTGDVTDASRASCGATAFLPKSALAPAALRRIWAEHGRSRGGDMPTRSAGE